MYFSIRDRVLGGCYLTNVPLFYVLEKRANPLRGKTMATINNSDSRPTGSDLFSDSEGYMDELDDNELDSIQGGFTPLPVLAFRVGYVALQSSVRCGMAISPVPDNVGRWLNRD